MYISRAHHFRQLARRVIYEIPPIGSVLFSIRHRGPGRALSIGFRELPRLLLVFQVQRGRRTIWRMAAGHVMEIKESRAVHDIRDRVIHRGEVGNFILRRKGVALRIRKFAHAPKYTIRECLPLRIGCGNYSISRDGWRDTRAFGGAVIGRPTSLIVRGERIGCPKMDPCAALFWRNRIPTNDSKRRQSPMAVRYSQGRPPVGGDYPIYRDCAKGENASSHRAIRAMEI